MARPVRVVSGWTFGGGGRLRELVRFRPWQVVLGRAVVWLARHPLVSGPLAVGLLAGWLGGSLAVAGLATLGSLGAAGAAVAWRHARATPGLTAADLAVGLARARRLERDWPRVARAAKLTEVGGGADARVAPLGRVTLLPGAGLRVPVRCGRVGRSVEQVSAAAVTVGSAMRCRQTPSVRPGDDLGTAILELSWRDALHRELRLRDLPAPPPGQLAFGLQPDGTAVTVTLDTSVLIVGITGAGKSGITWALLACAIAQDVPLRLRVIDPKGGMELSALRPHCHRYATRPPEVAAVLTEAARDMTERQERLAVGGVRRFKPTAAEPLDLLIVDEFLALTMFLPPRQRGEVDRALGLLITQGRAPGFVTWACSQGSQVDALGRVRDFIPQRVCLATPSVDVTVAALGDAARHEARCDRISLRTPGVGYMATDGARGLQRFRSVWVTDPETRDIAAGRVPPALRVQRTRHDHLAGQVTYLYRHFAADGTPLRYGITNDLADRWAQYEATADWTSDVATTDVQEFPDRRSALRAEAEAIQADQPQFNDQHNPTFWRRRGRVASGGRA